MLDLSSNKIGNEGVEYLSDALKHNGVIICLIIQYSFDFTSLLIHRHSLYWSCMTIKSEMKVHNISVMY